MEEMLLLINESAVVVVFVVVGVGVVGVVNEAVAVLGM